VRVKALHYQTAADCLYPFVHLQIVISRFALGMGSGKTLRN